MSAITMARDVVPLGVDTMVVCSQSGALSGIRFWKKLEPVTPFGKRCSNVGRSRDGAHDRRLDGEVVAGEVELGDAGSGNIDFGGLVISTGWPAATSSTGSPCSFAFAITRSRRSP